MTLDESAGEMRDADADAGCKLCGLWKCCRRSGRSEVIVGLEVETPSREVRVELSV